MSSESDTPQGPVTCRACSELMGVTVYHAPGQVCPRDRTKKDQFVVQDPTMKPGSPPASTLTVEVCDVEGTEGPTKFERAWHKEFSAEVNKLLNPVTLVTPDGEPHVVKSLTPIISDPDFHLPQLREIATQPDQGMRFKVTGVDKIREAVGRRAEFIVVDDPLQIKDAATPAELEASRKWNKETLLSRKVPPQVALGDGPVEKRREMTAEEHDKHLLELTEKQIREDLEQYQAGLKRYQAIMPGPSRHVAVDWAGGESWTGMVVMQDGKVIGHVEKCEDKGDGKVVLHLSLHDLDGEPLANSAGETIFGKPRMADAVNALMDLRRIQAKSGLMGFVEAYLPQINATQNDWYNKAVEEHVRKVFKEEDASPMMHQTPPPAFTEKEVKPLTYKADKPTDVKYGGTEVYGYANFPPVVRTGPPQTLRSSSKNPNSSNIPKAGDGMRAYFRMLGFTSEDAERIVEEATRAGGPTLKVAKTLAMVKADEECRKIAEEIMSPTKEEFDAYNAIAQPHIVGEAKTD